ncbi:hypothetical protein, partial [Desulfobacula sp.]|uniref:hypothetical protein n=1 Tax=Desulfobacula sp. TaxID=2593537 RepID=UPI002714D3A9
CNPCLGNLRETAILISHPSTMFPKTTKSPAFSDLSNLQQHLSLPDIEHAFSGLNLLFSSFIPAS